MKINNFASVVFIRRGLGNEYKKTKLYVVNNNNAGMNRILDDYIQLNFEFEEIGIIMLDNFIKNANSIQQIDLIEINNECFEYNVL